LRSAQQVITELKNAHFVMAGEGNLIPEMKDLAVELGIAKNCHFTGRCEKVAELLSISDVCVLSSTNEGFSNSILEYMSAGKPVVATNVGGASEAIIESETGYLVESNDDRAMASRLIELLKDGEKAQRMGELGRKRIEECFSISAQLERITTIYQTELNKLFK
jgi:glycosyltransferase involved in cell wall biosynthesis